MRNLICIFFILLATFSNAQKDAQEYNNSNQISEAININIAKQQYFAGENLLFGIQTIDDISGTLLNISKIVYVELISQTGNVIQQAKIIMDEGRGVAAIPLSKQLSTDYYYIRAYTRYMQNLGANHFAYQRFEVINPFKNFFPNENSINPEQEYINIFAEGQNIVLNVPNKIAVKCFDFDYSPIKTSITITDSTGVNITNIQSDSLGVAIANLEFKNEGIYNFSINIDDSLIVKQIKVDNNLKPSVKIIEEKDAFQIKTYNTAKSDGIAYLEIRKKNIIINKYLLSESNSNFLLKKQNLPYGIVEAVIVQNSTEKSRVLFINESTPAELKISGLPEKYNTSSTYEFEVHAEGNYNISYSIIDENSGVNRPLKNDLIILNQKFSYSELQIAEKNNNYLEYILIKTAYENFSNTTISNHLLPEFEGDVVSGKILKQENQKPVQGVLVFASIPDSLPFFSTATTNKKGEFNFVIDSLYSLNEIIFTVSDTSVKYQIIIDNEFSTTKFTTQKEEYVPNKDLRDYIKQQMINIQVADAYKSYLTKPKIQKTEKIPFYGYPSETVYFDKFIKLPIMEEYIKELMPGVFVKKRRKQKYIRIANYADRGHIGKNPLIIINGLPVVNHGSMLAIDPKTVDYVNIFNYKLFYKNSVFDGVFELKTKEPVDILRFISNNNSIEEYILPQQYASVFEFNRKTKLDYRIPDFRSLLDFKYFDSFKNNVKYQFNTSDLKGDYLLNINIINNKTGKEAREQIKISVE